MEDHDLWMAFFEDPDGHTLALMHEAPKGYSPAPIRGRNRLACSFEQIVCRPLTRKAIERALEGDPTALRLCLDRIVQPRRDRPTPFNLPKLKEAADARDALAAVVRAVAEGELTPVEASTLAGLIEQFAAVDKDTSFARNTRERKGKGPLAGLEW